MTRAVYIVSRLIVVVAVMLALAGLGLIGVSTLPFPWAKTQVDALSSDGDARGFTAEVFQDIAARLWPGGIVLLLVSAGLCGFHRQAAILIEEATRRSASMPQRLRNILRSEPPLHWASLGAIVIAGFFFRLSFLFQPIRHDEAYTFEAFASRPLYLAVCGHFTLNNHLLHTLFVWMSTRMFGSDPWSIRLPCFLYGLLLIVAVYSVIRAFYNPHAGLAAAGLTAASSGLIEYSTNSRGYSLIGLLFLLLLLTSRELAHKHDRVLWLAFSLIAAAGLCTVPSMMYPIAVCSAWMVLTVLTVRPEPRELRLFLQRLAGALLLAGVITAVVYLPAVIVSGVQKVTGDRYVQPLAFAEFARRCSIMLAATWKHWHEGWPWWLSAAAWVGLAVAILLHRRISTVRIPLIPLAIVVCLAMTVVQRLVLYRRIWLFLLPLYLGIAAAGLEYCVCSLFSKARTFAGPAAVALALGLCFSGGAGVISSQSVYLSDQTGTAHDAEAVTVFLKNRLRPGDRVIATLTSSIPLIYYFRRYSIPREYFELKPNNAARIIAVVDETGSANPDLIAPDQPLFTMAGALRDEGASLERLGKSQLIARFRSASVYSLDVLGR